MNDKVYKKIADMIVKQPDPGGELVKLLEALDCHKPKMILITQQVSTEGNPIVCITCFTNRMTDFPLETDELYVKWVKEYADSISAELT